MNWIKFKDSNKSTWPANDSIVVVAHHYTKMKPDLAICWFMHGRFSVYTDGLKTDNEAIELDITITHWTYLPEPPKINSNLKN